MRKLLNFFKRLTFVLLGILFIFLVYFFLAIQIPEPKIDETLIHQDQLQKLNDTCFTYEDSWLRKNRFGLWEMYISGSPEELGIKNGILAQQLIQKQEEAFVTQIKRMIPSESYLNFLKYITSYMNRKLPDYIPEDYLQEIKAVSLFASDSFNYIGTPYHRMLNYHAAHDIGHAMQNLHLVECSAFGVWNGLSSDSGLLVGRNFDFYVGDEFAENKIVLFVKPYNGFPFASITWGGMIGVVSGMNTQGLSITLNSAKSEIPLTAKTPVSIIGREILQFASNIQEAYEIAKKRPSFVAESFMISSAFDKRVAIIEKTPDTTILFETRDNQIILTNHFQSEALFNTEINQENIRENVTDYRWERIQELLSEQSSFDEFDFARILRDSKGLQNADIGLGNEGAVNQLIAHHSIIFKPEKLRFWISTAPFQLGSYMAYQLDSIFQITQMACNTHDLTQLTIPSDSSFLQNQYPHFLQYKRILADMEKNEKIDSESFINSNPQFFYTYESLGDYYLRNIDIEKAEFYWKKSLLFFIPNEYEKRRIEKKLLELHP